MKRKTVRECLSQGTWFRELPEALAEQILAKGVPLEFGDRAMIYGTGDRPTGLYGILSGSVRLGTHTEDGKQILYRVLKPGAWFGYLSMLDDEPRFQDAVCDVRSSLLFISATAYRSIVADDPHYVLHFSRLACQDLRIAMNLLAEMKATPLPNRVAQVLLQTLEGPSQKSGACLLTQDALASIVGASRQTINRVLRGLEEKNLIHLQYGRVIVSDIRLLAAEAECDLAGLQSLRRIGHGVSIACAP